MKFGKSKATGTLRTSATYSGYGNLLEIGEKTTMRPPRPELYEEVETALTMLLEAVDSLLISLKMPLLSNSMPAVAQEMERILDATTRLLAVMGELEPKASSETGGLRPCSLRSI